MIRWKVLLTAAASVVLGVAIVLSARAGNGMQASPNEQFVESLCAAALPHEREMLDLVDDVVHTRAAPGYEDGWIPLASLGTQARNEALLYRRDIRAVVPPATPEGVKAAKYLPFIAQQPLDFVADINAWIRALPRNLSLVQSIKSLNRIQQELLLPVSDMIDPGVALFANFVPGLVDEFDKCRACKQARAMAKRPPRT